MRTKLALLAVAAIVFAPGWGSGDAISGNDSSSDLAGRILAPTVEEASAQPQAKKGFPKRIDLEPRLSGKAEPGVIHLGRGGVPALVGLVAAAVALLSFEELPGLRPQRAPPYLLTV